MAKMSTYQNPTDRFTATMTVFAGNCSVTTACSYPVTVALPDLGPVLTRGWLSWR